MAQSRHSYCQILLYISPLSSLVVSQLSVPLLISKLLIDLAYVAEIL
jgi:hypothetical protein